MTDRVRGLRKRWDDADLSRRVAEWLSDPRGDAPPEVRSVDGREDLRGFQFGELTEFRGVVWSGVDFSAAMMSSLRLHDVHMKNCLFD